MPQHPLDMLVQMGGNISMAEMGYRSSNRANRLSEERKIMQMLKMAIKKVVNNSKIHTLKSLGLFVLNNSKIHTLKSLGLFVLNNNKIHTLKSFVLFVFVLPSLAFAF
jgi:hypothetical protein